MIRSFLIISLYSFVLADIIYVDAQLGSEETGKGSFDNPYASIQFGVEESAIGDTVLVGQGVYNESVLIDKSITLASYALYDNLSDLESWASYNEFINQWEVINDNISIFSNVANDIRKILKAKTLEDLMKI